MINLACLAIFSLLCLYLSVINRSINASEKLGFRRWVLCVCVCWEREGTNKAIYYVYVSIFTQIFYIKREVTLMI